MSSVARRSASKAAWFLSLIAGVAVLPASAGQNFGVTLVPAITTLTGNGSPGYPGVGPILASSAQVEAPIAVVADAAGNVYFSDGNFNAVWKITRATGIMAIFAGQPGANGSSGDGGPATSARFRGPQGLKFDSAGNLYIVDSGNSTVRRVDHITGYISTVAGTPRANGSTGDGGPATSAQIVGPSYIAFDGANNLYIADEYGNSIRRVDAATQIITTVAGDPTSARAPGQTGDGGLASSAFLYHPNGLSFDKAGNLYIADQGNNAVRRIDAATLIITTVAGDPSSARASGSTGDGGLAANSFLSAPLGVDVGTGGNLFIADSGNSVVREVTNDSNINTVAGVIGSSGFSGDGGAATTAQLSHPADIAFDTADNLFLADNANATVRDVNLNSTFPPTAVASTSASQNVVLHVTGTVTIAAITVPLSQGGSAEYAVGLDQRHGLQHRLPHRRWIYGRRLGRRRPFIPPIQACGVFPCSRYNPQRSRENIYPRYDRVRSGAADRLYAGIDYYGRGEWNSRLHGGRGPGKRCGIEYPLRTLAADYQGSLYISDAHNDVIRRVDGSTHIISGFAGNGGTVGFSGRPGPAIAAELDGPVGLHLDSAGDLYLSHSRMMEFAR